MTWLHLTAYFRLDGYEKQMPGGSILDLKDGHGRTPLSWAAQVDFGPKDSHGQTPLSWVANNEHRAVVKLLLDTEKVGVDSKDSNGQTTLSWAVRNGHEVVAELLLIFVKVDDKSKGPEYS